MYQSYRIVINKLFLKHESGDTNTGGNGISNYFNCVNLCSSKGRQEVNCRCNYIDDNEARLVCRDTGIEMCETGAFQSMKHLLWSRSLNESSCLHPSGDHSHPLGRRARCCHYAVRGCRSFSICRQDARSVRLADG